MIADILGPAADWYYALYERVLAGAPEAAAMLAERLSAASAEDDPTELALLMHLIAMHARLSGDAGLVRQPAVATFSAIVAEKLERDIGVSSNRPGQTWELGLCFAALRAVDLFLKREAFARLTAKIKNRVYATAIRAGTLTSSADRDRIEYDLLFASVPAGLFEPEDLVLVEAVRELADPARVAAAPPRARLLLAWYYAEQGSYAKSRTLVLDTPEELPLRELVRQRLKMLGQLRDRFIRHTPLGNGNRYAPLAEERFPKLVTAGDSVTVRAFAVPFSAGDPVQLHVDGEVIDGRMGNGVWEFDLPERPGGTHVDYHLQFANAPHARAQSFGYDVLERRNCGDASGARICEDGRLTVGFADCRLQLAPGVAGTLDMTIVPMPAGEGFDTANEQQFELAGCALRLTLVPFALFVEHDGRALFVLDGDGISWLRSPSGEVHEISLTLGTAACGVFGLGERYNALNQFGQRVDQFVYNQYKDQGLRTYIPMPVFYTDAGFGMHIDTTAYSWFDFAATRPERFAMGVEAPEMTLTLFLGAIADQVGQFITRTGDPVAVPDWALGPWMSSNNWDSDAEVRRQVALGREHAIPSTVLVIEAWSDEATFYIFNDARYTETDGSIALAYGDFTFPEWGRWPDPKGLVDYLHDNDLRCVLWQIPIVKQVTSLAHLQKAEDERALVEKGYGVRNADGSPYRIPEGWFKDSLVLDFTNPAARDWWFAKRAYLRDEIGIDGFKTDGGECIFGNDLMFADGSTGHQMRNRYPRDYISAYTEFAAQTGGITFSRSGYTGAQTFPAHWAGDERSNWDAFKRSLLAGLSSGLSGIIFWGWDFAGFSGPIPTAELYVRAAEMACFCPIMQYHAESKAEFNQDRTPWNIAERTGDGRALDIYRTYANLRMSLMPYLTREAAHCVAARTPMMRALLLDYQNDPEAGDLWDQYLFGRDLLVAPIIVEGGTRRTVHLPERRWWHLFENTWYGPGDVEIGAALADIPVFVREGAVVPLSFDAEIRLGAAMPSSLDAPHQRLLLIVGDMPQAQVHEEAGGRIEVVGTTETGFSVTVEGPVPVLTTILFSDTPRQVRVNGVVATPGSVTFAARALAGVAIGKKD